MHWVYPQPQQQHNQRSATAWNASLHSLPSNTNALNLHQTTNNKGTVSNNAVGSHTAINNSVLDVSSPMIATSGPPPSIKIGPSGFNRSTSNTTPSDHDDEWKNIHVVSITRIYC